MTDLLLLLGLAGLAVAAFMTALVLGIVVVSIMLIGLSFALADGKGIQWRS